MEHSTYLDINRDLKILKQLVRRYQLDKTGHSNGERRGAANRHSGR
jgi:hypothetical protein